MRLLVTIATTLSIALAAGFGFRFLFRKSPSQIDDDRLNEVASRLASLEAKLAELEERMDFTDRVLTDVRSRLQLPSKS
jgi:hypothetical protein